MSYRILSLLESNSRTLQQVRNLASDLDPEKHPKVPRGCVKILDEKSQDQWTSELRDVIENVLGIEKKKKNTSSLFSSSSLKAVAALGVVVVAALCIRKMLAKKN